MTNIDIIYYSATTTDILTGAESYQQAQYFVPFFDLLLVFIVFSFSILVLYFVDGLAYPKKQVIRIKNYLKIAKNSKIWN